MNLHVPREHLFEQSDGTWWFVVEGELRQDAAWPWDCTPGPHPPADLVALAAPCGTCENTGCDIDWCLECGDEYTEPCPRHADHEPNPMDHRCCPDCAARTLTIRTECKRNKVWCEQFDEHCLADNCDNGTVSLGPFRIETPVPIVAAYSEPDGGQDRVRVYDNGTATLLSGRTWKPWDLSDIDLGSDPARFVGWYAVKAVTA